MYCDRGGLGRKTGPGNFLTSTLLESPKSPVLHTKSPFYHFNPAGPPGIAQMQAWPVCPCTVITNTLSTKVWRSLKETFNKELNWNKP